MACSLCYATNEHLMEFKSEEAKRLHVSSILLKYFSFCFNVSMSRRAFCYQRLLFQSIGFISMTHIIFLINIHMYKLLQEEPEYGCVCRKCWCNVDVFHNFYLRIEEIQRLNFKTEYIEPMKCDVAAFDANELITTNEDVQPFENGTKQEFDNTSDSDNYFFENDGKIPFESHS